MSSLLSLLLAGAIAFLASTSQAATGFGFALVLVPLLSLLYDPKLVVVVSLTLGLICRLPLVIESWRHIEAGRIWALSAAAVVGTVLGSRLLIMASGPSMQLAIGLIVVVLATALLLEHSRPIKQEKLATVGVGLVSGIITGSTSMGGPPVVLFGVNQAWEKSHFRANLLAFFMISNVSALVALWLGGVVTWEVARLDALLLPPVLLGVVVGSAIFRALPASRFRRLVVLLIIASGALNTWAGASQLWGSP